MTTQSATQGGFNYQDAYNFVAEYGPSRLDVRHDFTGNAVVFLPWGFQASGIFRARTGLPFNAIANSDLNGDNVAFTDRPYSAPGVSFGRNSFRNRGFRNVDFRVLKDFRMTETAKIQFSAELFNLFNFDNVIFAGNTNVYGPGINTTTGAVVPADARFMLLRNADGSYNLQNQQLGTPLQAQFGLRFIF